MKRKLLFIATIALAVGCLLFLFASGFGHNPIGVWQVEKIELTACDEGSHPN